MSEMANILNGIGAVVGIGALILSALMLWRRDDIENTSGRDG